MTEPRKRNKPYGFANFDLNLLLPHWNAVQRKALSNMAKAVRGDKYETMPSRLLTAQDLDELEAALEQSHADNLANLERLRGLISS